MLVEIKSKFSAEIFELKMSLRVENSAKWKTALKVHSFSGSTVQKMEYFVESLLARYPDHIIIYVGTNNLLDERMTADRIQMTFSIFQTK